MDEIGSEPKQFFRLTCGVGGAEPNRRIGPCKVSHEGDPVWQAPWSESTQQTAVGGSDLDATVGLAHIKDQSQQTFQSVFRREALANTGNGRIGRLIRERGVLSDPGHAAVNHKPIGPAGGFD